MGECRRVKTSSSVDGSSRDRRAVNNQLDPVLYQSCIIGVDSTVQFRSICQSRVTGPLGIEQSQLCRNHLCMYYVSYDITSNKYSDDFCPTFVTYLKQ